MQVLSSKHWLLVPGRLDGRHSLGNIKIKNKEGARCSAYGRGYTSQTSRKQAPEPGKAYAASSREVLSAPERSGGAPLPPAVLAAILAAGSVAAISKRAPKEGNYNQFRPLTMDDMGKPWFSTSPADEVKQAARAALETMGHYFPQAVEQHTFVRAIAKSIFPFGFTNENSIALVNTCRDEVCRPIYNAIDQQFGLGFDIVGLGGLVNCGKTGFKAAMSHSPEHTSKDQLKERYIFFAFPHISVGETGEVGTLLRRGRGKPSNACGALIAITNNLKTPTDDDEDDAEFVLLKRKVQRELSDGQGLENGNLVDVTKAALRVITKDLENLVAKTVDPAKADYAVVTGILIHSGDQIPGEPFRKERTVDYIAPYKMYAVVQGERHEVQLDSNIAPNVQSALR